MLVFQKQSLVRGHRFEPPTIMCWEGMVIPGENTQNSLSLKNIHQEKKKKNIQSKQKTIVEICKQKEHLAVSLYLYLTTCQISDLLSYIPERPREMMHCVHLVPLFLLLIIRPSRAYLAVLVFGIRGTLLLFFLASLVSTPFLSHHLHSGVSSR